MGLDDRGQVNRSAAEVYEEFFVPALFAEWCGPVAEAARVRPGQRVLDVACGTGVLAREVAGRVGAAGSVVGLDPNEGMLAVAGRRAPEIEWRRGTAESLPFEDGSFDAVGCQFGLMFFEDRVKAVAEMVRVLRPGGHLAVAVWDRVENTPGYAAVTSLLHRLFGVEVADTLRAPFALGDTKEVAGIFARAGADCAIETRTGTARFPSIRSWMHTDVRGWTLADLIDDDQFARLLREAETELARFVQPDGSVAFASPAHIASRRAG